MKASNITPRRDLYHEVTERIIAAIESGCAPWQRPWTQLAEMGIPRNGSSQRLYQGINTVLLFLEAQERGYADNRWMTFRQANAMGHKVRKGEKSTPVVFFKSLTVEDKNAKPDKTDDPAIKTIPYLTEYRVFNAAQIEGMPSATLEVRTWGPVEAAERLIDQMRPDVRHGGNRAFYAPNHDYIQMPSMGAFANAAQYYGTLLHELGHWTGSPSRLNRQFGAFGDEDYAREELRAEWASAMLSAELGIPTSTESHAAYLASWVKKLRDDKYEIFRTARDAQRIANFILQRTEQQEDSTLNTAHRDLALERETTLAGSVVSGSAVTGGGSSRQIAQGLASFEVFTNAT